MEQTLIETFKAYYFDYRTVEDVDSSFEDALAAVAFAVIEKTGALADEGDLDGIRSLVREYKEIRLSTLGSNDSVKERFEQEYEEAKGRGGNRTLH